jgi:hypothetical protein
MSWSRGRALSLRATFVLGLMLCLGGLGAPTSASAAVPKHPFKETFGSPTPPTLSSPIGMALDQSNGDLYAMELGASSVSRWKPDGTPDNFSSLGATNKITSVNLGSEANTVQAAVNSSNGKLYVASLAENAVDIFNEDGSSGGQLTESSAGAFGEACGVAVDSSGHVYVADASHHTIDKFASPPVNGATEEEIPFSSQEPCNIAAGAGPSAGYVFVAGYSSGVFKVNNSTEEEIDSGKALSLSVDPATGHLYAATESEVKEFNASGASPVEVSSTPLPGIAAGVAVNWATGSLYASQASSSNVEVYAPPAAPTVTAVSPNKGPTAGGTVVTITGTGFQYGVEKVKFGATEVTCLETLATCKVESATEIKATTPVHVAGTVDVHAVTPGGESAANPPGDQFTFEAPPTVTGVSPSNGPETGGTLVTITGTGFTGATEVKWGSAGVTCLETEVTCKVISSTEIKATTPSHAPGAVDVHVVTPNGESAANPPNDEFTFEAPPTVTGVSPSNGPETGGTLVTITGTGFTGATEVKWGSAGVTCLETEVTCKVISSTEIRATTPSHASGPVDVHVVTPNGESAANPPNDEFTFNVVGLNVEEVTPNHGPTAGGTPITIKGTGFTGATKVSYGTAEVNCAGTPATCEVVSDTEIKATTPPHVAGQIDVRVTVGVVTSSAVPADHFTFEAPTITGVSPHQGPAAGGTVITITGTGFSPATKVKLGASEINCDGTIAHCEVVSGTEIKATTTPHAAGTVAVQVCDPGDCSSGTVTAANEFTFVAAPTVTGVSPSEGPEAGGTEVTITGTGFTGATEVAYGTEEVTCTGVVATCEVVTDTEIKATTPPHAAGTVDVKVTTVGGTSAVNAPADHFTFVAPPSVTEVEPEEGPTAGGTLVTLTGSGFTGATEVKFGTTAVTCPEASSPGKCVVTSDTEIEVEAPAHTAGTVDVKVTTPIGGTSPATAADEYTYVAPPAVTAVSPTRGSTAGGNTVVITGARLGGASKVVFGSTEATITENTETTIRATAPAHAAETVDIQVTTVGGTSGKFSQDEYAYMDAQSLSVGTAGTGSGSVSCNGGACAASYPFGSSVTLSAGAAAGSSFAGFSGACSGIGACTLTIEGPTAVTATFNKNPEPPAPPTPEGTLDVSGSAHVSGNQAALKVSCKGPGDCSGTITLKAKVKGKLKVIGKAAFTIPAGKSQTVKVKITNKTIKSQLHQGKTVKVTVSGPNLHGTVKLKQKK